MLKTVRVRNMLGLGTGAVLLFLLLALQGCASPGAAGAVAAAAPQADLLTESDEPEARKRARTRMQLAVAYFEQGQTTVALDELKQALVIDPSFSDAFNLRGLIYLRLNDSRMAEDSFRRALALNPREPNTMHNYGWLMCQQGRYPESLQLFGQALDNPTYGGRAKTLMALGLCQQRAGLLPEAERSLSRSYELDPSSPVTAYNLSEVLVRRGEFDRARFYIGRINAVPEMATAQSLWLAARIERGLGNEQSVQEFGRRLRERFPQSDEALRFERGRFD